MKKIILSLAGMLSLHFAQSQNVGIGTVTPQAKVHVVPDNAAGILLSPYGINSGQTGELRFAGISGSGYVALKAPDNTAAPVTFTLPVQYGSNGQALTTNGSGQLQWSNLQQQQQNNTACCMPTMLSNEAPTNMPIAQYGIYCDTLTEGGYTDWTIPTLDQLLYAAMGGAVIPGTRSSTYLVTRYYSGGSYVGIRLSDLSAQTANPSYQDASRGCRCAR